VENNYDYVEVDNQVYVISNAVLVNSFDQFQKFISFEVGKSYKHLITFCYFILNLPTHLLVDAFLM